jgi:succinoglycan biosynthesis transport protein ExoP
MATEYELTLSDYLSIVRRRPAYPIGTFVVVFLAALVAVVFIPRTYQSTGTIMVVSQNVPESVVPTQVQVGVDERINNIKQRVLTRESLLTIANKYNLFRGSASYLSSTELVQRMRDRVDVELVSVDTVQGFRTGKATIAFNLSFQDKSPNIAYQVANDLVTLFLNWNTTLQTETATDTTIFLAQVADKQKQEVERLNGLISAYKHQHGNALPELAVMNMAALQNDEISLKNIEQKYNMLSGQVDDSSTAAPISNSTPTSLSALKAKLASLSTIYSDSHPDIKALKLKIASLENTINVQDGATQKGEQTSQQSKIDSTKEALESLARQRQVLQDRIAQTKAGMMQSPEVAQQLDVLTSQRDSAQKRYEEIMSKLQSAQMAEDLKKENKSDRFVVLEPPVLPDKPFKPNPVKIMVMGFFLAIVASGGMVMVMTTFDRQIRSADALEHVLGSRPLAVIPYLVLPEEEASRKRKIEIAAIASGFVIILIVLFIQFFYMPWSELLMKILAKLTA